VLAAIARALPQADLTYLADTAHVPYGSKPDHFIRGRVSVLADHLVEQGCRMIVVACNTATVAAIAELRHRHPDIPIVGVEPGVKPAAASSHSGRIAVLATEITSRSVRLRELIRDHASHVQVHVEPCPGWATRVEMLDLDGEAFAAEVAAKVNPLLDAGADRLVLGCTHYSFLRPMLAPLVAGRAELVDVADAIARQVVRLAGSVGHGTSQLKLLATARPERLHTALPTLDLAWLAKRSAHPASLCSV
jgi:glutamate racemase